MAKDRFTAIDPAAFSALSAAHPAIAQANSVLKKLNPSITDSQLMTMPGGAVIGNIYDIVAASNPQLIAAVDAIPDDGQAAETLITQASAAAPAGGTSAGGIDPSNAYADNKGGALSTSTPTSGSSSTTMKPSEYAQADLASLPTAVQETLKSDAKAFADQFKQMSENVKLIGYLLNAPYREMTVTTGANGEEVGVPFLPDATKVRDFKDKYQAQAAQAGETEAFNALIEELEAAVSANAATVASHVTPFENQKVIAILVDDGNGEVVIPEKEIGARVLIDYAGSIIAEFDPAVGVKVTGVKAKSSKSTGTVGAGAVSKQITFKLIGKNAAIKNDHALAKYSAEFTNDAESTRKVTVKSEKSFKVNATNKRTGKAYKRTVRFSASIDCPGVVRSAAYANVEGLPSLERFGASEPAKIFSGTDEEIQNLVATLASFSKDPNSAKYFENNSGAMGALFATLSKKEEIEAPVE